MWSRSRYTRRPGSLSTRLGIVLRWPIGLVLTSWRYLWRITPVYPTKPFAPSVIGTLANSATQGLPKPKTLWSAFPRGYRARCSHADGASVLQISPVGSSPLTITPTPDATWGTHLADGSVALGTLVDLVRRQIEIWGERQQ